MIAVEICDKLDLSINILSEKCMNNSGSFLSNKLKNLSFISMIAVVFIHAYNYTDNFLQPQTLITEKLHLGACLEFLFSNALTRFAVPLFFALSGFFFFYKKQFSVQTYLMQVKKRCKSVLLVFIIISALSYLIGLALYYIMGPGINPMIDERMVVVLQGGAGFLYPLLQNPFAFQLWFLAQLFIMCLISPVIYFLVKKLKWIPLVALGVLWFWDLSLNIGTYTLFNCDAYMFFTLGAYVAVNDVKLPGLNQPISSKKWKFVALPIWIALSVAFTIMAATLTQSTYLQTLMFKLICLAGIVSIWLIFDNVREKTNPLLETVKRNNFAVYLFHEPLLHIIFMTVTYYVKLDVVHMLLYFVLPVIIIVGCAYLGELLRRKLPRLNNVITGGR